VFKRLIVAALLSAPYVAFAQGMSIDECSTLASKSAPSEIDTVIAPMQDGGGVDGMHEPGTGRGSGDVEHATADTAGSHAQHAAHGSAGSDSSSAHGHKSHGGKAAWQSLLPGVMK